MSGMVKKIITFLEETDRDIEFFRKEYEDGWSRWQIRISGKPLSLDWAVPKCYQPKFGTDYILIDGEKIIEYAEKQNIKIKELRRKKINIETTTYECVYLKPKLGKSRRLLEKLK